MDIVPTHDPPQAICDIKDACFGFYFPEKKYTNALQSPHNETKYCVAIQI